jgi:hypothetical protein
MKVKWNHPALLSTCGMLLLGAGCAQPAMDDATASRQTASKQFYKDWTKEQKRRQHLADQEAASKKKYYAEYVRQHGYPTHADRQRAIQEALKSPAR